MSAGGSGGDGPRSAAATARTVVRVPPVPTTAAPAGSGRGNPDAARAPFTCRLDAGGGGVRERRRRCGDEFLGHPDATQRKAHGLLDRSVPQRQAFQAAAPEVEDIEVAQAGQRRDRSASPRPISVASSSPDEDPERQPGPRLKVAARIGAVGGVADRARRHGDRSVSAPSAPRLGASRYAMAATPRSIPSWLEAGLRGRDPAC